MANSISATPVGPTIWERFTSRLSGIKRTKEKVVDPVVANIIALAKAIVNFGNANRVLNHNDSSGSNSFEASHPWAAEAMAAAGTSFVAAGFVATGFSVKNGVKRFWRALWDGDKESTGYHGLIYTPGRVVTAIGLGGKTIEEGMRLGLVSVPGYLPIVSDVCLVAGAVFSFISGVYGEVRTCQFEGKLTNRLAPIATGRDQSEILFELVFGKPHPGETLEEQTERLRERKEIVNHFLGNGFYENLAEYFGVKLDQNGLPSELVVKPVSFKAKDADFYLLIGKIQNEAPKINEARAAQWLFKKAFGKPLGPDATEDQRRDRYKIYRDRFIRLTSEGCYERVAKMLGVTLSEEEGIPADLTKDLKFDPKKFTIDSEFLSEIYRAIFQAKVIHALKIIMAALAIVALIALIVCSGGVGLIAATSIIFAIACLLQIPTQTARVQNWVGEKIWKRHRDKLVPERVSALFPLYVRVA